MNQGQLENLYILSMWAGCILVSLLAGWVLTLLAANFVKPIRNSVYVKLTISFLLAVLFQGLLVYTQVTGGFLDLRLGVFAFLAIPTGILYPVALLAVWRNRKKKKYTE